MNNISKIIKRKNLTYECLGKKIGVSQPTAWKICNGKIKGLKFEIIFALSKALDMTIEELYCSFYTPNRELKLNDTPTTRVQDESRATED